MWGHFISTRTYAGHLQVRFGRCWYSLMVGSPGKLLFRCVLLQLLLLLWRSAFVVTSCRRHQRVVNSSSAWQVYAEGCMVAYGIKDTSSSSVRSTLQLSFVFTVISVSAFMADNALLQSVFCGEGFVADAHNACCCVSYDRLLLMPLAVVTACVPQRALAHVHAMAIYVLLVS